MKHFEMKFSAETGQSVQCSISVQDEPQLNCGATLSVHPEKKKKQGKAKKKTESKKEPKSANVENEQGKKSKEPAAAVPAPPTLSRPIQPRREVPVPDFELPETDVHLLKLAILDVDWSECTQRTDKVDLSDIPSTFINPRDMGIDLSRFFDFSETITAENQKFPVCDTEPISALLSLEHLPGVRGKWDPAVSLPPASPRLVKAVQKLSGDLESVSVSGTRIAHALAKNSTSWLAHLFASYYWQVQGNGEFALTCLKGALTFVPYSYKYCPLLSLANLLQQTGHLTEAVVVTSSALDVKRENMIVHFTLANIYCLMEVWGNAALFYQSALGFDPYHLESQNRLRTILCRNLANQMS
ncbi:tetratricopeptide repeat domain 17 [Plakobranchus ocellatus]|uniref:Tetratricopeptide repeat domain 17 n=1 Tax=Plakobranchus ocellatus TaxID=259542 RepID=A0AAV4ATL9_9GAST|nr:tetratricopeptide repeat domain 17 [Plakobranchus ocellatus]